MAHLTDRRFQQAEDILEKYREQLLTHRHIEAGLLEKELRDLWGMGYRSLKGVMVDMAKLAQYERYKPVAVFYMENSNAGVGVVSEFQRPLAEAYGIDSWHYSPDREEKKKAYWDGVFEQEQ